MIPLSGNQYTVLGNQYRDSAFPYNIHGKDTFKFVVDNFETKSTEFVSVCGVYVDSNGRRSRSNELMWPALPHAVGKCSYLFSKDVI